jgi:integrase-like protein
MAHSNAFAERFVGSAKSECLERIVPLGEGHLRAAVRAFVQHYHQERPHQGLGNELIAPKTTSIGTGPVRSGAVRGSAACSSSTTARPRSLSVPAVGDPTHVVQLGAGDRVAAGERQRRVAFQRRVAACRVVVGLEVGKFPLEIAGIPEQHMVEKFSPHRADQPLHEWV